MSYESYNKIYDGIEVRAQQNIDKRTIKDTLDDLTNIDTYPHDGSTVYMKNGMVVSVVETGDLYMLIDVNKITDKNEGWKRLTGVAGGESVFDGGNALSRYVNEQHIYSSVADLPHPLENVNK